jgi:hypothetical protein
MITVVWIGLSKSDFEKPTRPVTFRRSPNWCSAVKVAWLYWVSSLSKRVSLSMSTSSNRP